MQTASAAQDKLIAERDEVINRLREQALTDKSSLATLIKELGDARKQLGKLEKEQKKAIKEIDHLKEERSALLEKQETLPDPEAIGAEIDKLAQKHKREVDKLNARVKSVQSALEEKEAENAALIERQEALPDPEAIGKEIDKLDAKHKKELDKLQRQLRTLKEELTEKDGLLKVKSTQHKVVSVMMSKLMEDQGRKVKHCLRLLSLVHPSDYTMARIPNEQPLKTPTELILKSRTRTLRIRLRKTNILPMSKAKERLDDQKRQPRPKRGQKRGNLSLLLQKIISRTLRKIPNPVEEAAVQQQNQIVPWKTTKKQATRPAKRNRLQMKSDRLANPAKAVKMAPGRKRN